MTDNYDLIVDTFNRTKEKQIKELKEFFTSESMIDSFLEEADESYECRLSGINYYNGFPVTKEDYDRFEKMYYIAEQAMYTKLQLKPEPISVEKVQDFDDEEPMAEMKFHFKLHVFGIDYDGLALVRYGFDAEKNEIEMVECYVDNINKPIKKIEV